MDSSSSGLSLYALIVDCKSPKTLSRFYQNLLGWDLVHEDETWSSLLSPDGFRVAFQKTDEYEPPVWPGQPGKPGQMLHLDFQTFDAKEHAAAIERALSLGARNTGAAFYGSGCVTLLDLEGHPFCILLHEHENGLAQS